jgi:hypothetical protein
LQWMVALANETIYVTLLQWMGGISQWNYICHPFALDDVPSSQVLSPWMVFGVNRTSHPIPSHGV